MGSFGSNGDHNRLDLTAVTGPPDLTRLDDKSVPVELASENKKKYLLENKKSEVFSRVLSW